jgi:lipopolysaccharide transport system ATP-binding protein
MMLQHFVNTSQHDYALRLCEVSKTYRIYPHPSARLKQSLVRGRRHYFTEHTALQPLTLEIPRGHTVGVVGVNGSGKSTLLQLITGTLTPSSGSIEVNGRVSALLELGAGFNPEFTGDENIYLNGSIMGLSRAEVAAKYNEIVAFSGLSPHLLQQSVKTYSSGMYVRLAFAVAIATSPDILIVDEALAVGDEGFQRKCFARIRELQEGGATILFVSHSARAVIDLCDHALLLDAGELLMQGAPSEVVAQYHKMLFAREQDRPTVRESIRATHSTAAPIAPSFSIHAPESRTEYLPDGGRIHDVQLTTLAGESTSLLTRDEEYMLAYHFTAEEDIAAFKCSMMLKTLTGIELSGALSHASCAMKGGEMVKVVFRFRCILVRGDYFINVGAVEEAFGTYRFLHRIVDALHIKVQDGVLDNASCEARGFVDLGAQCSMAVTP